jgi:hypothetical protein
MHVPTLPFFPTASATGRAQPKLDTYILYYITCAHTTRLDYDLAELTDRNFFSILFPWPPAYIVTPMVHVTTCFPSRSGSSSEGKGPFPAILVVWIIISIIIHRQLTTRSPIPGRCSWPTPGPTLPWHYFRPTNKLSMVELPARHTLIGNYCTTLLCIVLYVRGARLEESMEYVGCVC